jgi:hypothetical protein
VKSRFAPATQRAADAVCGYAELINELLESVLIRASSRLFEII